MEKGKTIVIQWKKEKQLSFDGKRRGCIPKAFGMRKYQSQQAASSLAQYNRLKF
ncbi:MAG: hypothetical protein U9N51_09195 [Bacteroidota bacterium]|nr:hypothetical protein [Bacteroidota bacterium]